MLTSSQGNIVLDGTPAALDGTPAALDGTPAALDSAAP
jgi:hypothetical protein